jgi:hypothetical protein
MNTENVSQWDTSDSGSTMESKGETVDRSFRKRSFHNVPHKLLICDATLEELQLLNGIGISREETIVNYCKTRRECGQPMVLHDVLPVLKMKLDVWIQYYIEGQVDLHFDTIGLHAILLSPPPVIDQHTEQFSCPSCPGLVQQVADLKAEARSSCSCWEEKKIIMREKFEKEMDRLKEKNKQEADEEIDQLNQINDGGHG